MTVVHQKIDLDVTEAIGGLEKLAALTSKFDDALKGVGESRKAAFAGAEQAQQEYNKQLTEGMQALAKLEARNKAYEAQQRRLKVVLDQLTASQQKFTKGEKEYENLNKRIIAVKNQIKALGGSLDDVGRKQKKVTTEGESMFKSFGKTLASVFAVGAVIAWGKQMASAILDVTAEFQKMQAVLTVSLGSQSAAQRAMAMIQDFASKTPYSVRELTDAYVSLASRGIRPTNAELTKLGDLAASIGASFADVTDATLAAMSGENERLKRFGIEAKRMGETTQFTFRGVTTEVKNTTEAIKDYMISLGDVEGVSGSMAAISETLTGQISNLGDSLDQLFLTLGNQNTPFMTGFTSWLSSTLEFLIDITSTTDQLAARMAGPEVAKFAEKTVAELAVVARKAKDSGQDVAKVLREQTETTRIEFEEQVRIAKKAVEDIGHVWIGNRTDATKAKAELQKYEGQLQALADAQRLVTEDLTKAENRIKEAAAAAAAKAVKEAAAARKKILQELYKELENLERQAAKARLDMMNRNSEAYLRAVMDSELEQVEAIANSIRDKNRLLGKDANLTIEQQQQINALSLAVAKKYTDALYKLEEEQRDKLLDLQKDSDEKHLQQISNKYDAEIRLAEEAGHVQVAIALRTAKERDIALAKRSQAEKNTDYAEELATASAIFDLYQLSGVKTTDLERMKQQKLLDIQIEFAEKRLALLQFETDEESQLRILQFKNLIAELNRQKEEVAAKENKFSLQKLLGLDDEQMQAVTDSINFTLSQLQAFLAESVAMRQREIQNISRGIDEKSRELDREIQLQKEGFASNIETKQAEYDALKKQREQAQKDQVKAQKAQVLLDTAMQINNLITASAEIFKVTASLNAIPGLGTSIAVGLIATMTAAFVAAKGKAFQAASVPTFRKGGGYQLDGPSHERGGIGLYDNSTGRQLAEYEGGEMLFAINRNSTAKHLKLLEAINSGNEKQIVRYALDDLLSNTGVIMNPDLPNKLQNLQTEYRVATSTAGKHDPYLKEMAQQLHELKQMSYHLKDLNERDKSTPQIYETENYRIEKRGNNTRSIRKKS